MFNNRTEHSWGFLNLFYNKKIYDLPHKFAFILKTNSADGMRIHELHALYSHKAHCLNQSERVLHWHFIIMSVTHLKSIIWSVIFDHQMVISNGEDITVSCQQRSQVNCSTWWKNNTQISRRHGGLMVSALDSGSSGPGSSSGGVIALCSWERHFTLSASLHTQEYINGYWWQNVGG